MSEAKQPKPADPKQQKSAELNQPKADQKQPKTDPITLTSIKQTIRGAPGKASEAIKTGKGNSWIERTQKLLSEIICSIPHSCRYLTLRQLLLTQEDKEATSRSCMLIGSLSAIVFLVAGIVAKSMKHLLLAAVFIIGFIISNCFISKSGVDTTMPTKPKKPKHSSSEKKKKPKKNDPDDFLL